jgi:hypothetical protein
MDMWLNVLGALLAHSITLPKCAILSYLLIFLERVLI